MKNEMLKQTWKLSQKLMAALSEENFYQAAYTANGAEFLVTLIFFDLFLANCFEVIDQRKPGQIKHLFKLKDEIDLFLFSDVEQVVASKMGEFRSLEELIDLASNEIEHHAGFLPGDRSSTLADSAQKIMVHYVASYHSFMRDAFRKSPTKVEMVKMKIFGGCY